MSRSPQYIRVEAVEVSTPPSPPPRTELRGSGWASLMLVLTCVVWGLSFPLMKSWQNAAVDAPVGNVVASMSIIALRMVLALAILGVFKPDLFLKPTTREHAIGVLVGLTNFVGFALQVIGLSYTTPARSGFLTSLCSVWVPLLTWLCFRTRVGLTTIFGLILGIAGTAVLSFGGEFGTLFEERATSVGVWITRLIELAQDTKTHARGDNLTFLASIFFAVAVILLDRLGKKISSGHLTVGFVGGTGLAALAVVLVQVQSGSSLHDWLFWLTRMLRQPAILRDLALLTIFSTVLAFLWMTTYQPRVPASQAALIYLLEPVFASLFSLVWGHDQLTLYLLAGGGLILGGNLLVELPGWLRDRRRSRRAAA